MKNRLVLALTLAGLLGGGFFLRQELGLGAAPDDLRVQQVNANLMRVQVNGQWEELPLMPLADHLCRSNNRLFDKYCGEQEDDQ